MPAAAGARRAPAIPPRAAGSRRATSTARSGASSPATRSLSAALEKALSFCNGYPYLGDDEGLGLLFCGDNGVGKTHLAVAVLRELVEKKGARGQFWDFHELIREIKNSYDPETKTTELQVLAPVVETDVLLLDDLGAWKMTDWMNDTLFYILNSRYMAKRATLITTNYQDVTREAALAADPLRRREFLVERIGQRLRSRLMEMCLVVRVERQRLPPGPPGNESGRAQAAVAPPGESGGAAAERPPESAARCSARGTDDAGAVADAQALRRGDDLRHRPWIDRVHLSYLWRRPRQLARSLVAMYVAVPVVILLLTKLLPMTQQVRTAVLVLAISAGAPLLPRKLMKLGREGYVFSLVVTSSCSRSSRSRSG